MEEYLKDAVPCSICGIEPNEYVERGDILILRGIPIVSSYGTQLICPKCNKHTHIYSNPQLAFKEWNEVLNHNSNRKEK